MKFGKQLRGIVDCSYPEWQPNFMSYKELKKRIVVAPDSLSESSTCAEDESEMSWTATPVPAPSNAAIAQRLNDSAEFFAFLQREVDKVNDFFLEKQEDFIIEHQQLSSRIAEILGPESVSRSELVQLRQRLIDFHAQLVILENYSTVNYTGFRKILKKHDKKTGLNVRSIALNQVSATPFFVSDTTRRLLLSTEHQIARLNQIQTARCNSDTVFEPHQTVQVGRTSTASVVASVEQTSGEDEKGKKDETTKNLPVP